ncbi:MAG: FG-GAP-like repeat-containing protein, partial [Bacteroidota bacterium]
QNFIQFQLVGSPKNRLGIGAKVQIETYDGKQFLENYTTRGYQSSVEPKLHFGLSNISKVKKAIITWPDNKVSVLHNLKANQLVRVDHKNAVFSVPVAKDSAKTIFSEISSAKIDFKHEENHYNDFAIESLLPHKMSQFGPALAVADINGDGFEDFYVGGASGKPGALYTQDASGNFTRSTNQPWQSDAIHEDLDAVFFDADNDGDLDLYIVSGGNEWKQGHPYYQDRLYLNTNGRFSHDFKSLPKIPISGSCVRPFDFDQDGDLDLFVGSRLHPQKYPFLESSLLLENRNGVFKDVTPKVAPELSEAGMVTDAIWTDFDSDGQTDLIVVGEWTSIQFFKNDRGKLTKENRIRSKTEGWWNSIAQADIDNDGDMDYVVGNLGLNYKYKASREAPFEVYATDFDDNGTNDVVLGYYNEGNLFPLRGRECSSQQMPFIKKKFPTYHSFGSANLLQVYGQEKLEKALHKSAYTFASICLENLGVGRFKTHQLPNSAQISSINAIQIQDFDKDGNQDILIAGNLYQSEVETPRNDASIGLLLKGSGDFSFEPVLLNKSGVLLDTDVKKMKTISLGGGKPGILVAPNSSSLKLLSYQP